MLCRADFRPDFKEVANLRSVFTEASLLGLSATVTQTVLDDIIKTLQLRASDVVVHAILPDRPTIFLEVANKKKFDAEEDLEWVAKEISTNGVICAKMLIFAQSIHEVCEIYAVLLRRLGNKAFVDGVKSATNRLVSMYHGEIGPTLQAYTLEEFPKTDSLIRVLICTIAFGLGMEIPDIRVVIHWGKCKNILAFWQEIGRCGRDGKPSRAIWYAQSVSGDDKEIFTQMKNGSAGIRGTLLSFYNTSTNLQVQVQVNT